MKSSSNLLEAASSGAFTQSWAPLDFSFQKEQAVEESSNAVFAELNGLDAEVVTAAIGFEQTGAFEKPGRAAVENQPGVRRWIPGEVQQLVTIEGAAHEGLPLPVLRVEDAPRFEETRDRLIQEMMDQAAQILIKTQAQAAEIIRQAQESAQLVLQDSRQMGLNAAEAETVPMIQTVQSIINQVQDWRDEMYAQSEAAVLNLVKEIAQTLFCEGLALDEVVLQQTFNRVLTNARSLGDLRIFVNPTDALNLGPYWREYQVSISGQQIEIIPSDSIQRGGCFVEGHMGTVDGRVETQLKAIMDAISTTADNNANNAGK